MEGRPPKRPHDYLNELAPGTSGTESECDISVVIAQVLRAADDKEERPIDEYVEMDRLL